MNLKKVSSKTASPEKTSPETYRKKQQKAPEKGTPLLLFRCLLHFFSAPYMEGWLSTERTCATSSGLAQSAGT